MIEPSGLERYTVEEVTGVLLEIIEENKMTTDKNTLVADYAFIGAVNIAFDRLKKRQRTFSMMNAAEIRARRFALNVPQGAVANYCGVTGVTYYNFERGQTFAMTFESMWYLWQLLYKCNGNPPDKMYLKRRRKLRMKPARIPTSLVKA